jgi:hypothetical protein
MRFERLHENRVNTRKNPRTCCHCSKLGNFFANYLEKMENKDGYKHWSRKDGKYQSRCDHKHKNKNKDEQRSRSSSSEDEGDRRKNKKSSKNFSGLSCYARDGFCSIAHSFGSRKSHQRDSDSNSEDEVHDKLPFLCEENEHLGKLLDNRDDMLREAKKMKEHRSSLHDARN